MIITLIGLGLLVVGIILAIIHDRGCFSYNVKEKIVGFGAAAIIIGAIITLCSIVFVLVNVAAYDVDYQNMLHEREMLEYRIDHMEDNITGNEMLYNDIVEFNNALRAEKKWALNPWTDWFNNKDVASIDYIELEGH
jgi:hypothetical protein